MTTKVVMPKKKCGLYDAGLTLTGGNTSYNSATTTALSNVKSETWLETTLGWDFDNVWEINGTDNFPTLKAFD